MTNFHSLRTNKLGHHYRIEQVGATTTNIINETLDKSIRVNHHMGEIDRGWYYWREEGKFIQDAFPFLTADEREFIQTGLYTQEFDALFNEDDK